MLSPYYQKKEAQVVPLLAQLSPFCMAKARRGHEQYSVVSTNCRFDDFQNTL
jgi:hypothetical protein